MKYIELKDLEVGYVYAGSGRNFDIGIWDGKTFLGARYKFGYRIDGEYHIDGDPNYGTFVPRQKLCKVPDGLSLEPDIPMTAYEIRLKFPDREPMAGQTYSILNEELLNFLQTKAKEQLDTGE